MPFGMINRFAGDHLKNLGDSLSKGYGAVDSQFGGILPGGAKPNVPDLVTSVAIEALPGSQPSPLDKQNKIINKTFNASKDLGQGDIVGAAARSHGTTQAGRARERVAEFGGRQLLKGGAAAAAGKAGTAIVPGLALYEGADLARGIYSDYLTTATGKNLGEHFETARDKRPEAVAVQELFPQPKFVGPSDGSTATLEQRDRTNPFLQEFRNRATLVGENFNPLEGEWGITEALYGR